MHAILSFTRLGLDKISSGTAAPDKLAHYLGRAQDSGQRLLLLLNDLLDLSKLEAGKVVYEFGRHDLRDILRTTLSELELLVKQRDLTVECAHLDHDTQIWCDASRIGQVIHHLLSNAIKFTPVGRQIKIVSAPTVLATRDPARPDTAIAALEVRVEDEGVGIPEGELEVIFDKFVQSSVTKSGAGGTGLGLSITREIVTQHGGSIRAENRPTGGAAFTLVLPREPITEVTDAAAMAKGALAARDHTDGPALPEGEAESASVTPAGAHTH